MNAMVPAESEDDGVSDFDLLSFLRKNAVVFLVAITIGVAVSAVWLSLLPSRYEATAMIEMAHLAGIGSEFAGARSGSLEAPALAIERMRRAPAYSSSTLKACGVADEPGAERALMESVVYSLPRGLPTVVEVDVYRGSRELAERCAQAIFDTFRSQQAVQLEPILKGISKAILQKNEEIANGQEIMSQLEAGRNVQSFYFWAKHEELMLLYREVHALERMLRADRAARLVVPVHSSFAAVYPRWNRGILLGAMLGLISGFGLVLLKAAFGRSRFKRYIVTGVNL